MYQNANKYIEKTREALNEFIKEKLKKGLSEEERNQYSNPDSIEKLLSMRAFDLRDDDLEKGDCILVMGLNPAGEEGDAEMLSDSERIYFYCFGEKNAKNKKEWHYNKYFSPILNAMSLCFKEFGGVKWPWCNYEWDRIEAEIKKHNDLKNHENTIKAFYDENHKNAYTIYVGDMYYYHETKSEKLPVVPKKEYCEEMLHLHLNDLKKHNKTVKFVYINNATVSNIIYGKKELEEGSDTDTVFEGVKVFFGGMLSGGRAMDVPSKRRLINDVRLWLAEEKKQHSENIKSPSAPTEKN